MTLKTFVNLESSMKSLDGLLGGAVKRAGIMKQVHSAHIVSIANLVVKSSVDPAVSPDVKAISYVGQELRVNCYHSVAAYEVKQKEKGIIAELTRREPTCNVHRILTRITTKPTEYEV